MKIMVALAAYTQAIFWKGVISVSEGGLAGETLKNIVVNIEGKIVPQAAAVADVVVGGTTVWHSSGNTFLGANLPDNRVLKTIANTKISLKTYVLLAHTSTL